MSGNFKVEVLFNMKKNVLGIEGLGAGRQLAHRLPLWGKGKDALMGRLLTKRHSPPPELGGRRGELRPGHSLYNLVGSVRGYAGLSWDTVSSGCPVMWLHNEPLQS